MDADNPAGSAWRPRAGAAQLRLRARMKARLRSFFELSGALEVDTPILVSSVPAERHIAAVRAQALGRPRLLRTSPESAMKRLLAAGIGDCWQLGPVFRDHEAGRWHEPEFQLLEWYRTGIDHHELMHEVEALLVAVLDRGHGPAPAIRLTYRQAFCEYAGIDPLAATDDEIGAAAVARGELADVDALGRDERLDWLLARVVVPALPGDVPVFVHAWPATQAALARLDPDNPAVAARFELYWQGIELANGFHELTAAGEQRRRLERDRDPDLPLDEPLLAALEAGLPACAGVALGFDRLVALAAGAAGLDEVIAFPSDRA